MYQCKAAIHRLNRDCNCVRGNSTRGIGASQNGWTSSFLVYNTSWCFHRANVMCETTVGLTDLFIECPD